MTETALQHSCMTDSLEGNRASFYTVKMMSEFVRVCVVVERERERKRMRQRESMGE